MEVLHAPILLQAGERLTGRRLWIAEDFAWNSWLAAVYIAGAGVVVEDVELYGASSWHPRWNAYQEPAGGPPGIPSGCVGIRAQGAPGLHVSGVHIEGFPSVAIDAFGVSDGVFSDVTVTRCFQGICLRQYQPNPRAQIRRCSIRDLWGPANGSWPGVDNLPSVVNPGASMGSDGIVVFKMSDGVISDCEILGEMFGGFKIVNPQRSQILRVRCPVAMVQGTSDLAWNIDKEPSRDTLMQDVVIDKSLGAGKAVQGGNGFQISWNVRSLAVRGCSFIAAGHDGHGVEQAGDCQASFQGCTFRGWNGVRGTDPAHALHLLDGAKTNLDFQPLNQFVDQQRILLDSSVKP